MDKIFIEPPWTQPDWFEQVSTWIDDQLARRGIVITGPVQQPHMRPWSTVLYVPTDQGGVYFKACADSLAFEARLTQALSTWRPDCSLQILAFEPEQDWILMADGVTRLREVITTDQDIQHWTQLLPLYAELQIELAQRLPQLLALGVPDRRLENLPDLYARLLEHVELLRIDLPDGLSSAEYQRLHALQAHFAQRCALLAEMPVPQSLHHGDLHDGNIFLNGGRYIFFDWGDSSVTHPFFSLRTVSVSLEYSLGFEEGSPEFARLRDAYLEPWRRYASRQELLEVFEQASVLSPVCSALGYQHALADLDPSEREEYQDAVPGLLMEFLSLADPATG